jgi:hypothetical protein
MAYEFLYGPCFIGGHPYPVTLQGTREVAETGRLTLLNMGGLLK